MKDIQRSRENGAAMVVFSVLILVLVAALALGLDIFIASSSSNQHHHTTEQAALAGMEAYITHNPATLCASSDLLPGQQCCAGNPPCSDDEINEDRLHVAAQAAGTIIEANKDLWLGSPFLLDASLAQGDIHRYEDTAPAAENGYIQAGKWHFSDPGCDGSGPFAPSGQVAGTSCPCDSGSSYDFVKPCFQELDDDEEGNALRLNVSLHSGAPITTLFAPMIGVDSVSLSSEAIVAETPRNGVYAIDISNSVVADTHGWNYTREEPPGTSKTSQFLYSYQPNLSCTGSDHGDPVEVAGSPPSPWPASDFDSRSVPLWQTVIDAASYNQDCSDGTLSDAAAAADADPNTNPDSNPVSGSLNACHVPSDYKSYCGKDYGNSYTIPDFVVEETFQPQPLTNILDAVHQALLTFETRAVGGDHVGILAFDEGILMTRATNDCYPTLGAGSCNLQILKPDSADPTFARWVRATDTSKTLQARLNENETVDADEFFDLFLFPRIVGSELVYTRTWQDLNGDEVFDVGEPELGGTTMTQAAVRTDLYSGLQGALQMFDSLSDISAAQNFVVVFSDGKTNCRQVDSSWLDDANWPTTGVSLGGGLAMRFMSRCADDGAYYRDGIDQVGADLITEFQDRNISFHMVLAGDSVQPHTILRKSGAGCATDANARAWLGEWVDGTGWTGANPTWSFVDVTGAVYTDNPFYGPNELWNFTARTNGRWMPIRNPCDLSGATDLQASFDAACGAASSEGDLITTGDLAAHLPGLGAIGRTTWDEIVDANGRLLCDPQSRDTKTQIADAINSIFEVSPYVLVRELE